MFAGFGFISIKAQIQITVNPAQEIKEISPYIYGRNNSLSDDSKNPTPLIALSPSPSWQLYKNAGVTFFRESGGNNSTKYNWRRKLSSHPDWYNNVYAHDWDYAAQSLQANMPEAKGMWAFQLLGYVAKTNAYNFNDWGYNQSQWWSGVTNNWCGGGGPGIGNGNPDLYLEPWSSDSTTAILSQWFDSLQLNKDQFRYWNMDNEPECWNSTHDDIMPNSISAEDYIQRYVAVAKRARTLFPDIKIVGPVSTNEWQWYNWQDIGAVSDLKNPAIKYSWMEYFIKRIAEEEQQSGLRLLDVLDFHFYPDVNRDITLQMYRVFYDTTYVYPGANGVHRVNGGWDNNINKEYIFKRSNDWLTKYMGANNGVTMGMSEMGNLYSQDPNVVAVGYASLLGTFAENNVELFTPWEWDIGQWEVLHLFTHYAGSIAVSSTSSLDTLVSAYSSLNDSKDTLSIILVNRDVNNEQPVAVSLQNAASTMRSVSFYRISNLPAGKETFVSEENNALQTGHVDINNNNENSSLSFTLPKLSVTAVQIPLKSNTYANPVLKTIQVNGFEREYMVYTPQNPQREKPDGIVVCLHGFSRTMGDFFNDYNVSSIADSLNLIIAAPQALPEQDPSVNLEADVINLFTGNQINLNSVWGCGLSVQVYSILLGTTLLNEELNKNLDDVDFINQMIDNVLSEYSLPSENIFMLGTSMGGYMAYQYALKKGERLSGLLSIAGSMGLAIKGMDYATKAPVCDFHSVTDEVVPYTGSLNKYGGIVSLAMDMPDVINYWVQTNGAGAPVDEPVQYYPSTNGITVEKITYPDPVNEVIHYKIDGAPHSYFFRKENGDCMDYPEEITKFIRSHLSVSTNRIPDIIAAQKPLFYPNPVQNVVHFSVMNGTVSVYDIAGAKVFSQSFASGQTDLSSLKAGIYIIRIQSGNMVQIKQFIKK